jgi:hypothetical protein
LSESSDEPVCDLFLVAVRQRPAGAMGANQQMRWSPQGAHMMLKVQTAVANGSFEQDYASAERWGTTPISPNRLTPPPFGRSCRKQLDC